MVSAYLLFLLFPREISILEATQIVKRTGLLLGDHTSQMHKKNAEASQRIRERGWKEQKDTKKVSKKREGGESNNKESIPSLSLSVCTGKRNNGRIHQRCAHEK